MRLLLPFCALLCMIDLHAQETATRVGPLRTGNFFLSAGGSWHAEEYRVKSSLRWSLDPQVGYFVADRFSLGLGSTIGFDGFNYSETNSITGITRTNTIEAGWWGFGPSFRGYLGSEQFALFAQLQANFGRLQKTSENNFTDNDDTYLREEGNFALYMFSAGAAYYFSDHIGLEAMANAYWVAANVRSGNVTENGQVDELNKGRYDATGGGWAVNVVYFFSLAQGRAE